MLSTLINASKKLINENGEQIGAEGTKAVGKMADQQTEPDIDFTSFLKEIQPNQQQHTESTKQDSIHIPDSMPTQTQGNNTDTQGLGLTGIEALDKRIQDRKLTMFDYYMARNYLGIDLNVYLQGDLNHKITNATKATADIFDTLKTLELGDEIIQNAPENSGIWNGLSRKLNQMSGGVWGINHDLAQIDNALHQYAYSTARSLGNGKTNLEQQKDAKQMTAFKARSEEENISRMAQNQEYNLTYLRNQIANLQALGKEVPIGVLDKLSEYEKKVRFINRNKGKINMKEYNAIKGDYAQYFESQMENAKGIKEFKR